MEVEIRVEMVKMVMEIIFMLAGTAVTVYLVPWIGKIAIPWLKEKRLYSVVAKLVKAAEKMAESGQITKDAKKRYVMKLLSEKGYMISDEVDALIECAVEELDVLTGKLKDGILAEAVEAKTGGQPEETAGAEGGAA